MKKQESKQPLEIERKYLIRKPTAEQIAALHCTSITDIIQYYLLQNEANTGRRIRKRGTAADGYRYYYTEKIKISASVRIEKEHEISKAEYEKLRLEADPQRHAIEKTRYCFFFEGRMYEMDLFALSDEFAFLEIELEDSEDIPQVLPPLDIIRDVTEEDAYTNRALAKSGVIQLTAE